MDNKTLKEPMAEYGQVRSPQAPVLSSYQMEFLDMISKVKSEDQMREIRTLLANYFADQAEAEMDRLWDEGIVNDEVLESWKNEHMRTPYRQ